MRLKHFFFGASLCSFMILFLTGCGTSHFTFSVRNGITGEPMEDVCVERWRGVGLCTRIFNPVGATYFPTYFDASNRTDRAGSITYHKGNPERDRFKLHLPPDLPWDTPLYVKINTTETKIHLTPSKIHDFRENRLINTGYAIYYRPKRGKLNFYETSKSCVIQNERENEDVRE